MVKTQSHFYPNLINDECLINDILIVVAIERN